MSENNGFEGWCILELFGHRRLGGLASGQEVAGAAFLRLDIYKLEGDEPIATQLYNSSAIYAITPTTERMARIAGERSVVRPVQTWELPAAEERPEGRDPDLFEEEPFDEEDEF